METSLLIVDDEYLERMLIRNIYPWNSMQINTIFEAETPQEAIDIFLKYKPKLVMMDIQMPEMDGLQLSAIIKNVDPDVEIIIITSHGNFQFAKQALQLGINFYVLKPIQKEEIVTAVSKALEHISKKEENNTILKESFFQRLVNGRTSDSEFEEKIKIFKLDFLKDQNCVILAKPKSIDLNNLKKDLNKTKNIISNILKNTTHIIFEHYTDVIIAIIKQSFNKDDLLKEDSFYCAFSIFRYGKKGIEDNYYEVSKLIAEKIILNKTPANITITPSLQDFKKHFINCLINNWNNDLITYINYIKDFSLEEFKEGILKIIFVISDIFWENGYEINDIHSNIYSAISTTTDKKDIEHLIIKFVEQAYDFYTKRCIKRRNQNLEKISLYIEQNLSEPELSLNTIATKFYLNNSYLSRIFKQYFNKNIVEYITEKRIEKAIELLNTTDLKVYEIATSVGIFDAQYFGKCFKKYTGKNIREYKNSTV